MNSISLVCTVHAERGLANVSELRAILERFRPEVIFLEIPPDTFACDFDAGTRENLESKAARQYREYNQVELVPVDLHTPAESFFTDNRYLFQRIEGKSCEYRRLMTWHSNYVRDLGFSYLNSEHCSKHWSDIYSEMLTTIRTIDEPRLTELYELWKKTIEDRDEEMMKNIRRYCSDNSFEKGLFLVGAAHRQAIIDKSKEQLGDDPTGIQWRFAGNDS
jgi:hypothetical protein